MGPWKKRTRTPKRQSPLTFFLLIHLVVSTNLLPTKAKLVKKTRITSKEGLGTKGDKKIVVAMTSLQRLLTQIPSRRKWKMFPKLSDITVTGKKIIPPGIPKRMQKLLLVLVNSTPVTRLERGRLRLLGLLVLMKIVRKARVSTWKILHKFYLSSFPSLFGRNLCLC